MFCLSPSPRTENQMFTFLPHMLAVSRWACAYFFTIVGIAYGTIMSRVPSIKATTGLNDTELGLALLCVGDGGVIAFATASWAQLRWSSKLVQRVCGLTLLLTIPLLGIPSTFGGLCAAFFCLGLSTSSTQVAMGTQGTQLEKLEGRPRMSGLYAMYSAGGLMGALSGSAMAAFDVSPLTLFCLISGFFLCLYPFAAARLVDVPPQSKGPAQKTAKHKGLPLSQSSCWSCSPPVRTPPRAPSETGVRCSSVMTRARANKSPPSPMPLSLSPWSLPVCTEIVCASAWATTP